MYRAFRVLLVAASVMLLDACVVYEPVPVVVQPSLEQRYDRSFFAALGALSDQGMSIVAQDRAAGVVRGERGGITVVATVQTLPDGRIQVAFESSGATASDPELVQRLTGSYERRMGR